MFVLYTAASYYRHSHTRLLIIKNYSNHVDYVCPALRTFGRSISNH